MPTTHKFSLRESTPLERRNLEQLAHSCTTEARLVKQVQPRERAKREIDYGRRGQGGHLGRLSASDR